MTLNIDMSKIATWISEGARPMSPHALSYDDLHDLSSSGLITVTEVTYPSGPGSLLIALTGAGRYEAQRQGYIFGAGE